MAILSLIRGLGSKGELEVSFKVTTGSRDGPGIEGRLESPLSCLFLIGGILEVKEGGLEKKKGQVRNENFPPVLFFPPDFFYALENCFISDKLR